MHFTKSVHLNGVKTSICDPHIETETLRSTSVHAARAYYHNLVCGYLDQHLPQHWIRCMTAEDQVMFCWPPRSPDLIPCDFLWGCVKDSFYRLYRRICLSCKDESLLPSQKLIITCCSSMGGNGLFA